MRGLIPLLLVTTGLGALDSATDKKLDCGVFSFVEGRDKRATAMQPAAIEKFADPFASLVLRERQSLPAKITEVVAAVDKHNESKYGLPEQLSFFVSESGTIHEANDTAGLVRTFRMVLTRAPLRRPKDPVLFMSAPAGNRPGILEVMGWDPVKKAFNFYRRPDPNRHEWHYKGDSRDAFDAQTAERGCFACHRHGMPLMKELEAPWVNWHTQSSQIPREAIPNPDVRDSDLFRNKSEGEVLEPIVEAQIRRLAGAEVSRATEKGVVTERLLRPLFQNATANLASSPQQANIDGPIRLPRSHFFDVRTLSALKVEIPPFRPVVPFDRYKRILRDKYKARLKDGAFERPGDSFFAFVVPEKAAEEVAIIDHLVGRGVITRHFALCVTAVDFPNPIESPKRASLLRYVPATSSTNNGRFTVSETIAAAIEKGAAGKPAGSAEYQFLELWRMPEDKAQELFEAHLAAYAAAVERRLETDDGFADMFRLAATRRHWFLGHPLAESPLLFPESDAPGSPPLRMNEDGTVSHD